MTDQPKKKIPTDPIERSKYFAALGTRGGKNSAQSPKASRPFRDTPGLAKKAGSTKGYKFERRKKPADE